MRNLFRMFNPNLKKRESFICLYTFLKACFCLCVYRFKKTEDVIAELICDSAFLARIPQKHMQHFERLMKGHYVKLKIILIVVETFVSAFDTKRHLIVLIRKSVYDTVYSEFLCVPFC